MVKIMERLEKIHETINAAAKDPQVNITKIDDFTLEGYEPWPRIKGEVAV